MSRDQRKLRVFYYHHRGFILTEKVLSVGKFLRPVYDEVAKCYRMNWADFVRMLEGVSFRQYNQEDAGAACRRFSKF